MALITTIINAQNELPRQGLVQIHRLVEI